MIPIDQTNTSTTSGNCHQASLASILELPLDEVPDFCNLYDDDNWAKEEKIWLKAKFNMWSLTLWAKDFKFKEDKIPDTYHLISGKSPRDVMHSCVGLSGEIIHDPHPSKKGLVKIEYFDFFILCDPQEYIKKYV